MTSVVCNVIKNWAADHIHKPQDVRPAIGMIPNKHSPWFAGFCRFRPHGGRQIFFFDDCWDCFCLMEVDCFWDLISIWLMLSRTDWDCCSQLFFFIEVYSIKTILMIIAEINENITWLYFTAILINWWYIMAIYGHVNSILDSANLLRIFTLILPICSMYGTSGGAILMNHHEKITKISSLYPNLHIVNPL